MRKDNTDIEQQFIALYDSLSDAIFRHCAFRLSNRERALDLMQETFTKAWDYIQSDKSGKDIQNPNALVYRIANNLIIDEYRKKKSVSLDSLHEEGFDVASHDELTTLQNAEFSQVKSAIAALPEKYRQIVTLRFINDFSITEIAEVTKQTENAVSVQINRAIKMLKDTLNI